ncbi:MAG: hypothetical protein ACMUIL_08085 [bacterium]
MKTRDFFYTAIVLVLTGALLFCVTQRVYAAGTAAGTPISNSATIDYTVNGIEQTPIESSPSTFVVDNKVDLTVETQGTAPVSITPGGTEYVLTFLVNNEGNRIQDYLLAATAVITGGETNFDNEYDDFDMNVPVAIYVDTNNNGTYEPGTDTATFIDNLAADSSIYVFIVANAPLSATNGQYASYYLTATTRDGETGGEISESGTDDPNNIDIVFADPNGPQDDSRDGKHSAQHDYKCLSSVLTINKTSEVKSDPINDESNPKRIPGAVVEYTITVSNAAGAATATGITVSDDLSTEIGLTNIEFHPDGYASGYGIQVTAPNINGGSSKDLSNVSGDDEGAFSANTVTVTGIDLDGGESATVTFQVEIQ